MTIYEKYELLKKDFILKSQSHLLFLEGLTVEDVQNAEIKSDLANYRLEATTSYSAFIQVVLEIKQMLKPKSRHPEP